MKDIGRAGAPVAVDVTWNDIGGLDAVKKGLNTTIVLAIRQAEVLHGDFEPVMSFLLVGPPGCGKALLAKAVAKESGSAFISVTGTDILDMHGQRGPMSVSAFFMNARNFTPYIIFLDDFDKMCPKRSTLPHTREGKVHREAIKQLLLELDRVVGGFVLASSRNPDNIDPEAMTKGRLTAFVHVTFPSTADDRTEILKVLTKQGSQPFLGADVSLEDIAKDVRCNGFSGNDLAYLVRQASRLATEEFGPHPSGPIAVNRRHFEGAFCTASSTVTEAEVRRYRHLKYRYNSSSWQAEA